MNFDTRYLYIILGLIVIMNLFSGSFDILGVLLTLPGVLVAITFHEYAHALAAYKLGDDTPKVQGRLNLNPLTHLDPIAVVLLVFTHIGWGKPVEINPTNFNRKRSMSAQEAIVAFAGPLMNILIAIVLTIVLCTIGKFAPGFALTKVGFFIVLTIQLAIQVNIGLGVFNLVPLPPLDGSKILMHFLPYNAKTWFKNNENTFYIIFLVLWITNIVSYIIDPVITVTSNGIYALVSGIFGLFG